MVGSLIILSEQEGQQEDNTLFNVPIGLLDPYHPAISPAAKKAILKDRYHDKLISDGIETGNFSINSNGDLFCRTNLLFPSFAGFIFEALAVRMFNDNMRTTGRNAFEWCTNRTRTKNDYIDQFKAIGVGFATTRNIYPDFYHFQHRFDVQFIRKNSNTSMYEPALFLGTTRDAGVQIKAITGGERVEIIDPLISGKYSHVLTFLRHRNGKHSHTICMEILRDMYRAREIDLGDLRKLEDSIKSPEMLGEDQRDVDEYYDYILDWYQGRAKTDYTIYEGIALEVKGFKYQSGLLVPDN